jgi:hypothetical protein
LCFPVRICLYGLGDLEAERQRASEKHPNGCVSHWTYVFWGRVGEPRLTDDFCVSLDRLFVEYAGILASTRDCAREYVSLVVFESNTVKGGVRLFVVSAMVGILFAICAAVIGLSVGGGLLSFDWVTGPRGGMIFTALVFIPAVTFGTYGFLSTQGRFYKRQPIEDLLRGAALLSTIGCGGLFLKAASLLVSTGPNTGLGNAGEYKVVGRAALVLGVGFLSSILVYGALTMSAHRKVNRLRSPKQI